MTGWEDRRHCEKFTKVDRDPELKSFVDSLATEQISLNQMHEFVVGRFGRDRSPSRSALHRYLVAMRKDGGGVISLIDKARKAMIGSKKARCRQYLEEALEALREANR